MPLEKFSLNKIDANLVEGEASDEKMINNILETIEHLETTSGLIQGKPAELHPGQLRHPVYNEPRLMSDPSRYSPEVSPDSTVPPNPQKNIMK